MAIIRESRQYWYYVDGDVLPTVGVTTGTYAFNQTSGQEVRWDGSVWKTSGIASDGDVTVEGGLFTSKVIGHTLIIELTESASYTLPSISGLPRKDIFIKVVNTTTGSLVVSTTGSDTVASSSSINIAAGSSVTFYIVGTDYR